MTLPINMYDITQTRDPSKRYKKIYEESDYSSTDEWFEKVRAQQEKLERGIFAHQGNLYFAQFERLDLTQREFNTVSNTTTTINRIVKFVWVYKFLK